MKNIISLWPEANAAANANDKTAVRTLLIDEIENSADKDTFLSCFNPEYRCAIVRDAAEYWVEDMEAAAAALREEDDAEALTLIERANSVESAFGDNPCSAHILHAAKWLAVVRA